MTMKIKARPAAIIVLIAPAIGFFEPRWKRSK